MATKWRAECLSCPWVTDPDYGHQIPTVAFENENQTLVKLWRDKHMQGRRCNVRMFQSMTIPINVEHLNTELLDLLTGRKPKNG